jgi:hypothetical protein
VKTKPNYKAFAKDLMKLCAKHGVRLSACHMGNVFLGSASERRGVRFDDFQASPTRVVLGDPEYAALNNDRKSCIVVEK